MPETKKVPAIRFNGFSIDWEQYKLSDILKRRQVYQQISTDAPRLAFAAGQGVIPLSERKTNNRDQLISNEAIKRYLLTEYNDLVYNPANLKYGAIDRNKYGKGVISPIYVTFTTTEEPSFIERIIITDRFKFKALQFEEGTVVKRQSVSPDSLLSFEEWISPNREEQKQIGSFFDMLDNLIAFHQHKLETLTKAKKSMLKMMFPQGDAKVPEVRFAGFYDDWEQRKLSELVTYTSSGLTAKDCKDVGEYALYDANGFIGKTDASCISNDYITVIKDGAGVGRIRKLPKNTMFIGTMGALQAVNSDLDFIYSLLTRFSLGDQYSGSTIPHIYFKDYGNNEYLVPQREEQIAIGKYFMQIDHLIALHQHKQEKLKQLKASFLEKMFV